MALEDKILKVLERGAITYDGLLAELGATPGELDKAIRHLETAHEIARDRGRFHLNGADPPAHQVAAAVADIPKTASPTMATKKKVCSCCNTEKSVDDFPANKECKDGHSNQCKACIAQKSRARRLAKAPAPATKTAVFAPKDSTVPPVMILHFHDGVRIGPVCISATGVAQMPYHVDVSAGQLDELTSWWLASKKDVA
jgi:hypothetical protein